MHKRIIAATFLATTILSACSLGGSSESVVGGIDFTPLILNNVTDYQITENQGNVAFTVSAIDPNLQRLSLEISGPDGAEFMHETGGVIEFVNDPDFEVPTDANGDNIYEIVITVSDGVNSDVENFTVEVLDDVTDNAVVMAKCLVSSTHKNHQSCSIPSGGLDRAFTLYVPSSYAELGDAVPLLFSMHGDNGFAETHLEYSGFQAYADKAGFIVAYPQGSVLEATGKTHWNTENGGIDDVAFMGAVSDYLTETYKINTNRIYAAGMGAGGAMSYHLGCEAADRFAAVGSVAGAMTTKSCSPARAVPSVHIHGKLDSVFPYAGSALTQPIDNTVGFWAKSNDCASAVSLAFIPDTAGDNDIMGGIHTGFGGCDAGTGVDYYLMDGLGHAWPDRKSADIHAAETLWGFFSRYDLNGAIK